MKIIVIGENLERYIAKCHEAFKTGLKKHGAVLYGHNYEGYDEKIKTCDDLFERAGFVPDLMFVQNPIISGIRNAKCKKVSLTGDYWSTNRTRFNNFVEWNGIDSVMFYFRGGIDYLGRGGVDLWVPPCYDPEIFKDWGVDKIYDIGFLNAGSNDFYPERAKIHQALLNCGMKYLHRPHPGWGFFNRDHELVGSGFSKAIGSCEIFVTTSGKLRHPNPKYFEAIASGAVLAADMPDGGEELGFIPGVNFIEIPRSKDAVEVLRDALLDKGRLRGIREAGMMMVADRHSCEKRAAGFIEMIKEKFECQKR